MGLELAAVLLLAAAGLAKVRTPSRQRSALAAARLPGATLVPAVLVNRGFGLAEVLVAAVAGIAGGRMAGLLLGVSFGLLALVSARMVRVDRGQDCGCFARPAPINSGHTAVNLGFAAVGVIGLVQPVQSLPTAIWSTPVVGAASLLGACVLAYLAYLTMTALPGLLSTVAELEAAR